VLVGTAVFGLLYEHVSPRAAFHTGAVLAVLAVVMVTVTRTRAGRVTGNGGRE
jgi:predicted MFS family arabinose efflux permease